MNLGTKSPLLVKILRIKKPNTLQHLSYSVGLKTLQFGPVYDNTLPSLCVRCKSTSKTEEKTQNPNINNELDSTDPDSIYAKVKYEEKVLNDDTKGHDGIASSPDHFSSLDDNESNGSIGDRIKKGIDKIFTKK
jgi:hypothetical protein